MPGVHTRCNPGCDSTTRSRELKSARACAATRTMTEIASTMRLFMFPIPLRHARDSELPLERGQLVEIDWADDVHDRQFPRLGGDDHQAGDRVAARLRVDLDVVARATLHSDDPLPLRPELPANIRQERAVVGAFFLECVIADIDAVELPHHLADAALFSFVIREKL